MTIDHDPTELDDSGWQHLLSTADLQRVFDERISKARAEVVDDLLGIPTTSDTGLRSMLVDWETFWQTEFVPEWLAEPVIPAKRATALFAPGGTGKSLLALFIAAALAAGRDPFSGRPTTPIHVLYLDYEMTDADLFERLESMGYGPESDLSRLHYALLPSLPGLDSPEGGKAVARLAEIVGAELVVIDTFGRAVHGDENDANTVLNWYRWTAIHLKRSGRAFVRVDHAGKDLTKGQRGTSAKNDDVDVVWQMTRRDGGYRLSSHIKRRMGWVPAHVDLTVREGDRLRFGVIDDNTYPTGTVEVAKALDELGIPLETSARAAGKALTAAGRGARAEVVRGAVKYRARRSNTYHLAGDNSLESGSSGASQISGRAPLDGVPDALRDAWAEDEINALVAESGRAAGRVRTHPPDATGTHSASL